MILTAMIPTPMILTRRFGEAMTERDGKIGGIFSNFKVSKPLVKSIPVDSFPPWR